jgi:alkylation response protein AidB-like acyl-CoA dehydrogenase
VLAPLENAFFARAAALDAEAAYPVENIADLARVGALVAPLPRAFGGLGAGTEPAGAEALLALLRGIGRLHLPTGRLFEGHVNALKLIARYGTQGQMARAAQACRSGAPIGLWVTEQPPGLRLVDGSLEGGKIFCSGAGFTQAALVTARAGADDQVMLLVSLEGTRARPSAMRLAGMRAAVTGAVDFSGLKLDAADMIGSPGDYLRQPEFSAGAWRSCAVTLGGLDRLVELVRAEFCARDRADDAYQRARVGRLLIAQEGAALWVGKAARLAEAGEAAAGDVAGYVNLARLAVEAAVLEAIGLAQRGLGLSAFALGHPVELVMRDLATYLRQPAPDETLSEAAGWFMRRGLPA